MQKTLALCVNWASGQCANHLGCDACAEADCCTAEADEEKSLACALDTRAVSGRVLQPRLQHGLGRRKEKALSGGREES